MGARGRKSLAELTISPTSAIATVERPPAPYNLTDEQVDIWVRVTSSLPADWFPPETHDILVQYCRHVTRAERLRQLIDEMERSEAFDVKEYRDLLRSEEEQSRAITSLGTKLRITTQSTVRAESAKKPSLVKRPWDV